MIIKRKLEKNETGKNDNF